MHRDLRCMEIVHENIIFKPLLGFNELKNVIVFNFLFR